MSATATPRPEHADRRRDGHDDGHDVIDLTTARSVSRTELIARLPAGSRYAHADLDAF